MISRLLLIAGVALAAMPLPFEATDKVRGSVEGLITLRQEDRFRLEDDEGVGYLFTLKHSFRTTARDLEKWVRNGTRVTVFYKGRPDMGALAEEIKPSESF